jgi:hypothetical protein
MLRGADVSLLLPCVNYIRDSRDYQIIYNYFVGVNTNLCKYIYYLFGLLVIYDCIWHIYYIYIGLLVVVSSRWCGWVAGCVIQSR